MASIHHLRLLVALVREAVAEYTPGEGARCPLCVRMGHNPGRAPVTKTEKPRRQHKCPLCGNSFSSVEKSICRDLRKKKS